MTCFMISDHFTFFLRNRPIFLRWSCNNTIFCFIDISSINHFFISTSCNQGCFIQNIFKIGTDKSWCLLCNQFQIYILSEWFVLSVNSKNRFTTFHIWTPNQYFTVKTARTKKGWIQNI